MDIKNAYTLVERKPIKTIASLIELVIMLILARIIFLTQKIAIVTNPITCIMAEKEVEFNDIMN